MLLTYSGTFSCRMRVILLGKGALRRCASLLTLSLSGVPQREMRREDAFRGSKDPLRLVQSIEPVRSVERVTYLLTRVSGMARERAKEGGRSAHDCETDDRDRDRPEICSQILYSADSPNG